MDICLLDIKIEPQRLILKLSLATSCPLPVPVTWMSLACSIQGQPLHPNIGTSLLCLLKNFVVQGYLFLDSCHASVRMPLLDNSNVSVRVRMPLLG